MIDPLVKIEDLYVENERLRTDKAELLAALKPFADYAGKMEPPRALPPNVVITNGSPIARKQLTMGDCYNARDAITKVESK